MRLLFHMMSGLNGLISLMRLGGLLSTMSHVI
jgi:hypothetical protein